MNEILSLISAFLPRDYNIHSFRPSHSIPLLIITILANLLTTLDLLLLETLRSILFNLLPGLLSQV